MKLFLKKILDRYWFNNLFLFFVLLLLFWVWIFNLNLFIYILKDFINIFVNQILFVLLIVFVFMFILNILIEKEFIKNKIKNAKSITKYFVSIIWGIFSTWPVYMWYPFLKQLKNHWLSYGHIATFIYARAVKIPFLAVMIMYFGLKYTIIFNLVLIFLALVLGIIIDLLFNLKYYEKN